MPGSSVMRKMSAVALSCRSGRSPTRRDGDDARQAEVGPQQAGADHAVMRHDDQPVDLLVAGIGEREHRPVGVAFARAHVHAAHDAVGAGRGRHLDAVVFGALALDGGGEVDRGGVGAHVDGLDARAGRSAEQRRRSGIAAERQARRKPKRRPPARRSIAANPAHCRPGVKSLKIVPISRRLPRGLGQPLPDAP